MLAGRQPLLPAEDDADLAAARGRRRAVGLAALATAAVLCGGAAVAGFAPAGALRGAGAAASKSVQPQSVDLAELNPQTVAMIQRYLEWMVHHADIVQDVGAVIFCTVFFSALFQKGLSGFTEIARTKGCPAPCFWAVLALLFISVGTVCLLAGIFTPNAVLAVAGAKTLFVFLLVASWLGHGKPLGSSSGQGRTRHIQSLAGNVSLMGFLVIIVGRNLTQLPENSLYDKWMPMFTAMAPYVVEVGKILAVAPFLADGLSPGVRGFTAIARGEKCCCAPVWGFLAAVFALTGSLCLALAHFIPSDRQVWYLFQYLEARAFCSIVGEKLLFIFLIAATYIGHIRIGKRSTATEGDKAYHRLATVRNVSIMGGLLFNLGHDLKGLGL